MPRVFLQPPSLTEEFLRDHSLVPALLAQQFPLCCTPPTPPHPTPPRGESRTRMSNSTSPAAVRQSMLNPVTPQSDTSEASLSQLDPVTPVTEGGSSYTHCGSFLATSIMCYRGWKTKDQPSPSPLEATGQNEMVSPSSLMRRVCYPCALAAGGVAS